MELSIFPCICCISRVGARTKGFNPGVDVYEMSSNSFAPPDIELLWKCRNIVGGHIWSEGKSDQHGGLGAVLSQTNQPFPRNLRYEIVGISTGCAGDTSALRDQRGCRRLAIADVIFKEWQISVYQ